MYGTSQMCILKRASLEMKKKNNKITMALSLVSGLYFSLLLSIHIKLLSDRYYCSHNQCARVCLFVMLFFLCHFVLCFLFETLTSRRTQCVCYYSLLELYDFIKASLARQKSEFLWHATQLKSQRMFFLILIT